MRVEIDRFNGYSGRSSRALVLTGSRGVVASLTLSIYRDRAGCRAYLVNRWLFWRLPGSAVWRWILGRWAA